MIKWLRQKLKLKEEKKIGERLQNQNLKPSMYVGLKY